MALDQLLLNAAPWLAWSGLALFGLTAIAFIAKWGVRFRLVGVSSFTLLLSVSCWAFAVSYTPPVVIEGATRAPVVFDNGSDLVVAHLPSNASDETIQPTLEQLAGNLRASGRSTSTVTVRLRSFDNSVDGRSRPLIRGELKRDFRIPFNEG